MNLVNASVGAVRIAPQRLITFQSEGLIPTHHYWFTQYWGKSSFDAKSDFVEGEVFDQVDDFTREQIFSKKNIKVIPKSLLAYELNEKMCEGEILLGAVNLGITRYREDFFGKQIFHDYPDFVNMSLEIDKEVNLFDIHQIALRHKLQDSEVFSRKLPAGKNIHFMIEGLSSSANKMERTLKTYHVIMRVNQRGELVVTGNEFIANHKWPQGELVVFIAHKNFVPYENHRNLN